MQMNENGDREHRKDNWALHEELSKEYVKIREARGGKSIHTLASEAHT